MKKSRVIATMLLSIILAAGIFVYYQFNKPHRDFSAEEAAYTFNAEELVKAYQQDPSLSDSLYVDQLVAVSGEISQLKENALLLSPGIYLSLDSTQSMDALLVGQQINLVGRVLSYDPLFEEVKMDNARIQN
mgnify:FL=1|tara:strand:- start:4094 stop:4489 length:396 start_codon:yes stop_codon:yes gene_type:complete